MHINCSCGLRANHRRAAVPEIFASPPRATEAENVMKAWIRRVGAIFHIQRGSAAYLHIYGLRKIHRRSALINQINQQLKVARRLQNISIGLEQSRGNRLTRMLKSQPLSSIEVMTSWGRTLRLFVQCENALCFYWLAIRRLSRRAWLRNRLDFHHGMAAKQRKIVGLPGITLG